MFARLIAFACAVLMLTLSLQAAPRRAILLVMNSQRPQDVELHRKMVDEIKNLRELGQLGTIPDLRYTVGVYDASKAKHAKALKVLGLASKPLPYVAVVNVDSEGLPHKVLWGKSYTEASDGLASMTSYLGLGTVTVAPVAASGLREGPVFLPNKEQTVQCGDRKLKYFFSMESPANYKDIDSWVARFRNNKKELVGHASGRYTVAVNTLKNDSRLLIGWFDVNDDTAGGWVVVWKEPDGLWHYRTNRGSTGSFDTSTEYAMTWSSKDEGAPTQIRLRLDSPPKELGTWTDDTVLYEITP